jgi:hypothetical protein
MGNDVPENLLSAADRRHADDRIMKPVIAARNRETGEWSLGQSPYEYVAHRWDRFEVRGGDRDIALRAGQRLHFLHQRLSPSQRRLLARLLTPFASWDDYVIRNCPPLAITLGEVRSAQSLRAKSLLAGETRQAVRLTVSAFNHIGGA